MSTSRNDDDTPRPDPKKSPDAKEDTDAKEGTDAEDTDAEDTDAEDTDAEDTDAEEGPTRKKGPTRKSTEERLNALKKKKEKLNNRIDRLSSAKRAQDRKNDTRRKIIIGGIVQRVAEHNEKTREWLRNQIEKQVKSVRDRELFTDILKDK